MESPLCPDDDGTRLIETFGFWPGQGIPALDLHLERMSRSAAVLGFRFERAEAKKTCTEIRSTSPLRCRLTCGRSGDIELTTSKLTLPPLQWVACLAPERLTAHDPWLRHKTTRRALYDQTRATLPPGIDEVIFLNTAGHLCEGTICNLFVTLADGRRVTPALSCGLLPGIYRQQELVAGRASEATITLNDLRQARSVTAANALRGEIPLHLQL